MCPCFRRRRTGDIFCLSHFESPREPTTVVWSFCGVAERDTKRPHALSYLFCRAVFTCCSRPPRLGIYLMCIPISRRPSLAGQGVRDFQGNPGGCKGCPRPLVSTTPMSKIKLGPMSGRVLPWEVIGQVANAARIWHSTSDLSLNASLQRGTITFLHGVSRVPVGFLAYVELFGVETISQYPFRSRGSWFTSLPMSASSHTSLCQRNRVACNNLYQIGTYIV